jgi:hypothetical protein
VTRFKKIESVAKTAHVSLAMVKARARMPPDTGAHAPMSETSNSLARKIEADAATRSAMR